MKVVGVFLHHFHRLEVFKPGLFANLVFPVVGVASQVSDVGDVSYVADLEAQMLQIPVDNVERQKGAHVAQVHVAVDGRTAHVHAHEGWVEWLKAFFLPGQAVGDVQGVHVVGFGFKCKEKTKL